MQSDGELLRGYAETRSEEGFAELVRRHLDLVYSAALRQVNGDAHLTQDVAQTVFADLARKAGELSGRAILTGWLYTSTHFAAAKAVRGERRRQAHEQEAHAMRDLLHDPAPGPDWDQLRPVLDAAMLELNEADREAVLLRFFERRQHAEIGVKLGVSENTARMRVERALEKLRAQLARRGVTTAAAALSAVISTNAVQAAPAGLAVSISATAAIAGTAIQTSTAIAATKAIAMTTMQKTVITATLAIAVGTGIYEARQAAQLREQVQTLVQRQTPMTEQFRSLEAERDEAVNKLALLAEENAALKSNSGELLRLRAAATAFRDQSRELAELREKNQKLGLWCSMMEGTWKNYTNDSFRVRNPYYRREDWSDRGTDDPGNAFVSLLAALKQSNEARLAELTAKKPEEHTFHEMLLTPSYWTNVVGAQIVDINIENCVNDGVAEKVARIGTIVEKKRTITSRSFEPPTPMPAGMEDYGNIEQTTWRWRLALKDGQWQITGVD